MQLTKTPIFIRKLLPEALWQVNTNEKEVYLTFDDGPTPSITQQVLTLLAQYNAKATFFCIGKNVENHPAIYKAILNSGHSVGNHTHNHVKGWTSTNQNYRRNIEECANHVKSNLFRPPYGRIKFSQYQSLKKDYQIVMWDILSWDFLKNSTPEKCARNVIQHITTGNIIVFHDSEKAAKNCIGSLQIVLDYLTTHNYMMKALPFIRTATL